MNFINVIINIIFFVFFSIIYLRYIYILISIKKVHIPLYFEFKDKFKNDYPYKIMKKRKREIFLFIMLTVLIIPIFFKDCLYILVASLIFSIVIANLTFKSRVWEMNFFSSYKDYLK